KTKYKIAKNNRSKDDMENTAFRIVKELSANAAVVKGGHRKGDAIDYLYDGNEIHTLSNKRINTKNTHGTGCTYAAAITSYLSQGYSLYKAVEKAKYFVTQAIKYSFDLGQG